MQRQLYRKLESWSKGGYVVCCLHFRSVFIPLLSTSSTLIHSVLNVSQLRVPQHSQKFGDVDMSSGKNMLSSIRGSTAAKNAGPAQVAPPQPPAFQRNTSFAPPPKRMSSAGAPARTASPAPPPALPRRQPTQEEAGEWAEALYPYTSDVRTPFASVRRLVSGKLIEFYRIRATWIWRRVTGCLWWRRHLMTGTCLSARMVLSSCSRTFPLLRWTGEIDGRRGLIPAAYVKML